MSDRASLLSAAVAAKQAFDDAEEARRATYNTWKAARDAWVAANDALNTSNALELARAVEGKR